MQSPNQLPPEPTAELWRTRLYGLLAIILVSLAVPVLVAVWCWLWGVAVENFRDLVGAVTG